VVNRFFSLREETLDIWVIEAENGQSGKMESCQKREEGSLISSILYNSRDLWGSDVGHHRRVGISLGRAIALIGFGVKILTCQAWHCFQCVRLPPITTGVETTAAKTWQNERSGGGLS